MKTRNLTAAALLTALAMILGLVERMLPLEMIIPLPGIKLGLANVVTLVALYRMGAPEAALILGARCLLSALFSGSMTGLAFSLTGGAMALAAMAAARKSRYLSIYGASVLGAAAHHCGQIGVASLLMHSGAVWGYLPYLLLAGTACGLATGSLGAGVLRRLRPADEPGARPPAGTGEER